MTGPALGFSTWAFPGESVDYAIDYALANEYGSLEVALLDPALFNTDQLLPTDEQARHVAARVDGLRLSVHAPIDKVCLADLDPGVRLRSAETMRRTIHLAHLMNAEVVVCHLNHRRRDVEVPQTADHQGRQLAADHLGQLGQEAASAGITIGVENVGFSDRAADRDFQGLRELIDQIDLESVGITFDVGHANVCKSASAGVADYARLFADRIVHYHLHDNDGTADQHRGIGSGSIDYAAMFQELPTGYRGNFIMEVFPTNEPDVEAAVVASRANLLAMLAGLAPYRSFSPS